MSARSIDRLAGKDHVHCEMALFDPIYKGSTELAHIPITDSDTECYREILSKALATIPDWCRLEPTCSVTGS